jgi:choline dehydrogenase
MSYDFIIIGAGSAGCVLADRLSENGKYKTLLLEAGGTDRTFFIQMPIGYGKSYYNKAVNWMYETEVDPGMKGRKHYWPRGKVLGGSSAINAMVYIRGLQGDFEDWKNMGNPGWGWDDVFPSFKKIEAHPWGASSHHGASGRMRISVVEDQVHPLCQTYLKSCEEAGFGTTDDFNGPNPEGGGIFHITTHKGIRESTASAFLRPALKRSNLELMTKAHVTRILFEGKRAVGVEYQRQGKTHKAMASREVILSGGSINSPQLLQLSGVGPTELLNKHNINVIADMPGVGRNLQDHLGVNFCYQSTQPTLNEQLYPWWGKLYFGIKYILTRRGPLSLSINQGGGFVRVNPKRPQPNIQLYFQPVSYTKAPEGKRQMMGPDPYPAIMLGHQPCRPTSRGYLEIKSADPFEHPSIHPAYLTTEDDKEGAIEGAHAIRKLAATPAMKILINGEIGHNLSTMSDEDIIEDFRARAGSNFHPVSTCRMGPDPLVDVVDNRLKVHGLEGLRVIDASIFPTVTSGNTNAPAIMVGERGASFILEDLQ